MTAWVMLVSSNKTDLSKLVCRGCGAVVVYSQYKLLSHKKTCDRKRDAYLIKKGLVKVAVHDGAASRFRPKDRNA